MSVQTKTIRLASNLATLLLALALPAAVLADDYTSASFIVRDPVIDAGGTYSSSASFQNFSKIGQTNIGQGSSASFLDCNGFLYFEGATPPAATATAGNASAVVNWTLSYAVCSQIIDGYQVGISTTNGGPHTYQSVGPVTTLTKAGLTNGTPYYFVVRAMSGTTVMATSNQATATPAGGGGGGGGFSIYGSVLINDGDASTDNRNVSLRLNGSYGTAKMAISNHPDLHDATMESYVQTKTWDLCKTGGVSGASCNDGSYTVYARFYDANGTVSSSAVWDAITLSTGQPTPIIPPTPACQVSCGDLRIDPYIVTPLGDERRIGTKYVKTSSLGTGIDKYNFEDKGLDWNYTDVVLTVDHRNCAATTVKLIWEQTPKWRNAVRAALYYQGKLMKDIILWPDALAAVSGTQVIDFTADHDLCANMKPVIAPVATPQPTKPTSDVNACKVTDCRKISYDLYIVNPDGTERHTGSDFIKVKAIDLYTTRHYFEDKGNDMDYDDVVFDINKQDCRQLQIKEIALDATWRHQVRLAVYFNGVKKRDSVVWPDSHLAAGQSITVDAGGADICGGKPIVPVDACNGVAVGTLLKGTGDTVYYVGRDCQRHVFPNAKVYKTWYKDFSGVKSAAPEALSSLPLGPNVKYRPGERLVKLLTDPHVFAVAAKGVLRWIMSGNTATELYGLTWKLMVDDLPDAIFSDYGVGEPITGSGDFNPAAEKAAAPTIDDSQGFPTANVSVEPAAPVGSTPAGLESACVASAVFTDVMGAGSTNVQVRPLQALLRCLGHIPSDIEPTGLFGTITERALINFQKDHGLDPVGFVSAATMKVLNASYGTAKSSAPGPTPTPAPVPKPATTGAKCSTDVVFTTRLVAGSENAEVSALQSLLRCLGYFPSSTQTNGYFGPATVAAVKAFQKANGLEQLGEVGPGTRAALNAPR